jgi:radical SAM superfamily enzyme YgiQ (UPF0313 family)
MKILLIQPPVQDFYATPARTYPLGLLYVGAGPLAAGHKVTVLDAVADGRKRVIPVPGKMQYLRDYYVPGDKSPFRLFGHYYHFGMTRKALEARIRAEKPDVVGISSLFTPYHHCAMEAARAAKTALPGVPVIMGGAHVSACGDSSGLADHVVRGPGEKAFLRYLGIGEEAPLPAFPARELINPDSYRIQGRRMAFMTASRGCPHRCAFCGVHSVFPQYRPRPPDEVLREAMECMDRFGVRHLDIEDDHFGYNPGQARQILSGLARRRDPDLVLSFMNGMDADALDGEMLRLLKQAGCRTLNLSLVSVREDTVRALKRPVDPNAFADAVRRAHGMGFSCIAYGIIGLPQETPDDMLATLRFLFDLPAAPGPSIFYPVPGTPLFSDCLARGYIRAGDHELFRLSALPVETERFSRQDLFTLFFLGRILNAVKEIRSGRKKDAFSRACVNEFIATRRIYHYLRDGKREAKTSAAVLDRFFSMFTLEPV